MTKLSLQISFPGWSDTCYQYTQYMVMKMQVLTGCLSSNVVQYYSCQIIQTILYFTFNKCMQHTLGTISIKCNKSIVKRNSAIFIS